MTLDQFGALLWPILGAVAAGAAIGFEREFRGRPAGFRTHILVALASALLMLAAADQAAWAYEAIPGSRIVADPTRMAHGVLTGIGFLCAGVIFREGFSIHGLTTAASLWMTSALGILFGVGLVALAVTGTIATLVVLAVLRLFDNVLPQQRLLDVALGYVPGQALSEAEVRDLLGGHGLALRRIGWASAGQGVVTHELKVRGFKRLDIDAFAAALAASPRVARFEITPRDD